MHLSKTVKLTSNSLKRMNTMGDRELVSSTGCSRCLIVKFMHRGAKKATVQARKRLVTSSRRSGNRVITGTIG